MKVKAFQVRDAGNGHPFALEMIAAGIDIRSPKSEVESDGWKIKMYDQDAITFSHDYLPYQVGSDLLGTRRNADLCRVYGPDSWAWNAFPPAMHDPAEPDVPKRYSIFEGRFNASQAYYASVYPVSIFADERDVFDPDSFFPRQLFIPVFAAQELINAYGYDYFLTPAIGPAMVGDVVYQLNRMWDIGAKPGNPESLVTQQLEKGV